MCSRTGGGTDQRVLLPRKNRRSADDRWNSDGGYSHHLRDTQIWRAGHRRHPICCSTSAPGWRRPPRLWCRLNTCGMNTRIIISLSVGLIKEGILTHFLNMTSQDNAFMYGSKLLSSMLAACSNSANFSTSDRSGRRLDPFPPYLVTR